MMNAQLKTALGVAGGVALFGLLVYVVKMLPNSALTTPIKKVAEIATTR